MATARTLILAIGVALAGLLIGLGFARGRASDRFVVLKQVDERPVRADLAIWPLHLVAADGDLDRAHARIEDNVRSMAEAAARRSSSRSSTPSSRT